MPAGGVASRAGCDVGHAPHGRSSGNARIGKSRKPVRSTLGSRRSISM